MQNKLYSEYASVREKIAALEEKEAILKEKILADMTDAGNEKLELDFGSFVVRTMKKWTYSKKVAKIEEDLKIQKFTEQEKGIAQAEEKRYLAFITPKEE